MKIVFLGTPQFAVPTLERLLSCETFEVAAVVTQPDKRRGRGNDLMPSPVKGVAVAHHSPVWQPQRIKKDREVLDLLRASGADAFVVVAYGQILSQEILEMPRLGCINGHGSLLPQYRGAAPIQWCLYHGEAETGITTMLMDAGMDTGAMLLKAVTPIAPFDNAQDLAKTLAVVTADLIVDTLLGLDQGSIQSIPQDHEQATYAPLISKENYGLDWTRGAIALHNQVRGFYPNCITTFRDQLLKVTATAPITLPLNGDRASLPLDLQHYAGSDSLETAPGTVVELLKNQGAVVETGEGRLLLKEVQMAGKRSQSGWDFVNGTRLQVGEVLTTT
jgi:methionyl-tRNA formyltransferase